MRAARLAGVKTLTTVYVWSQVGFKRRVLQWIDERMLSRFDQVTAHCEAALRELRRALGAHGITLQGELA